MCILIRSKPPIFQSPQCTRHGKTFDTRISVSWLPDLDSYAVSVGQPGDLNSRISGFSSEVDHGSWSCLGLLLDEYTCRLKSGGLLLTILTGKHQSQLPAPTQESNSPYWTDGSSGEIIDTFTRWGERVIITKCAELIIWDSAIIWLKIIRI